MSKLSPVGQSMAALFTPEGEKLRSSQKEKAAGPSKGGGLFRIPGAAKAQESGKAGDSLGNPSSPGYERLDLSKKTEAKKEESPEKATASEGFTAPAIGPEFVRLGSGWEKILLAQRKLCDKAKNLLTILEGPIKYRGQRKATLLEAKARGSILDLDMKDIQPPEKDEEKKAG